jgi:hypothetical protein
MRPLNFCFRLSSTPANGRARPSFGALSIGALGLAALSACGTSGPTAFDGTSTGSNSTATHFSTATTTTVITSTLADGGVVTSTSTGTTVVTNTTVVSSTKGSTGTGSSNSTSTGSGSGSTSTGTEVDGGDGGVDCTNTDMTKINIDSSGWVCNNQWAIQGAWYCYADSTVTSNSCAGEGYIPFNTTSNAMCISGTTSTSQTAYTGAAIGLVLNQPQHGVDTKDPYNTTAKNIVGFAITISGSTGGSVLNINFPPQLLSTGESAAVTVPAVSGNTVTYNVLFADAIMSDNTTAPIEKIDPTKLTDVQVAIPGADGMAHNYNYCVTKIVPLMAAAAAPGTLSTYGASFNEGKQIVLEGLGAYGIQNDVFNIGTSMAMTASYGNGQVGFTATPMWSGSSLNAFPSIVSGWVTGGNFVSGGQGGYAGGKTIGALSSVKSNWAWSAGGASSNWDAAYDVWFASNQDPLKAGTELMVWVGHSNVSPIGGQTNAVTISGAPGTWTYSTGTNPTNQPVISYVSSSNITNVSALDLLPFFKDAANNGRASLSSGSYLLSVQAGFELYSGGNTWTTTSYSINIQ